MESMDNLEPGYLKLIETNDLECRVLEAQKHLMNCDVCPLACGADRLNGEAGVCRTGRWAKVSSYGPHMGEEKPLRGFRGSGTIFFTRCNLSCQFCQNAEISQTDFGSLVYRIAAAIISILFPPVILFHKSWKLYQLQHWQDYIYPSYIILVVMIRWKCSDYWMASSISTCLT